jgi:hypothetical protein
MVVFEHAIMSHRSRQGPLPQVSVIPWQEFWPEQSTSHRFDPSQVKLTPLQVWSVHWMARGPAMVRMLVLWRVHGIWLLHGGWQTLPMQTGQPIPVPASLTTHIPASRPQTKPPEEVVLDEELEPALDEELEVVLDEELEPVLDEVVELVLDEVVELVLDEVVELVVEAPPVLLVVVVPPLPPTWSTSSWAMIWHPAATSTASAETKNPRMARVRMMSMLPHLPDEPRPAGC